MRKRLINSALILLLLSVIFQITGLVDADNTKPNVEKLISQLSSDSRQMQYRAFYNLKPYFAEILVQQAVVRFFEREIKILDEEPSERDKIGEEKFIDVIQAIVSFKKEDYLPLLFSVIDTGNYVVDAIADYGEKSYNIAIREWNSNERFKMDYLLLFGKFAEKNNLSTENLVNIKNILISMFSDENYLIRKVAVQGLSNFSDPEAINHVKTIKETDPYFIATGENKVYFPVREEASKALEKMKN